MGTCGTCKHWRPPGERNDFSQTVALYSTVDATDEDRKALRQESDEADQTYGLCQGIPMGPIEEKPLPLALTMDASEYQADLFTQAEFGCVLFEEK